MPKPDDMPPVILSTEEIARFRSDGFLVIDRTLVGEDDLAVVRRLIDDLFDRFDALPREWAYDLGDVQHHAGPQQIPEINLASRLEPRLVDTNAFARCRDLARQLLSDRTFCSFDHAISKPPHNGTATEWHQDLATAPQLLGQDAVHIWLPLQDATEANGCMQFIPDDPPRGLLPHHRRGDGSRAHALVAEGFDPSAAVSCPIEAGRVTVHRLTTLHYTGPNTTDNPRVAWIMHFHKRPHQSWRRRTRVELARIKRRLVG